MLALLNTSGFTIASVSSAVSVYVEGVDFYGGNRNMTLDRRDGGTVDFYAHRVGMFHATGPTSGRSDNLVAAGARDVFLQECAVKFSNKDGANYARSNIAFVEMESPRVIELDCDMGHNGLGQSTDLSCNASTGHTGAKIIRVGGTYQDTMGGVVCDVHTDTQSINAGITVRDSQTGLNETRGSLISAGQGVESWVFGGNAYQGGTVDVYAEADSAVRGAGLWHFTDGGPGTLDLDLIV
ncbi:hypothetical protein WDU99_01600 [Microbacterium sp. Mu-80]|uniref:Uncharacterized protein n=1 Tax=Microbacterium bandirmense TaxID=3122050 RepID=A0ABU8L6Q4_9MICO